MAFFFLIGLYLILPCPDGQFKVKDMYVCTYDNIILIVNIFIQDTNADANDATAMSTTNANAIKRGGLR